MTMLKFAIATKMFLVKIDLKSFLKQSLSKQKLDFGKLYKQAGAGVVPSSVCTRVRSLDEV